MDTFANRPVRLLPNRVRYLIPGGAIIDRFLGLAPGSCPGASQMWVASVVQSMLDHAPDTRSYIRAEDGGGCLAERLQAEPDAWMGNAHAARFGASPGFLFKLLHSDQRLLVQVHPDKEKAMRYFGTPFGKTEAWYVLDTQEAEPACVWVGFRPEVTRERFRELILRQDCPAILNCLHCFPVKAGDVVFIPAGLPHALGGGCLTAEIQEPTDLTLRAERFRPDGSELPWESLDSGIGMDALLDCFDFSTALPREEIHARCFVRPECNRVTGEEILIGPEQTDCFGLIKVECGKEPRRRTNDSFRVLLVEQGSVLLTAGQTAFALTRGEEVFVPSGVQEYSLTAQSDAAVVLECVPPSGKPAENTV